MSNSTDEARRLLDRGNLPRAATLLKQAEQAGDAEAARELACWLLEGRVVQRNLAEARAYFGRAAELVCWEAGQADVAVALAGGADP